MENEELKTIEEGKETEIGNENSLEGTSPSEATEEITPELNSTPVPTPEQKEEAGISTQDISNPVVPENENVAPEIVEEPTPTQQVHEENGVTDTPVLKTFTQSQVNEMVGNTRTETRDKTFRYIYNRYGVEDEAGLDELIGNAQRYDSLQEQYDVDKKTWKDQSSQREKELADVKEQIALMQSGIDSGRYEDAKFILRGKGLEVNLDNIKAELATHPEWQGSNGNATSNPNFTKVDDATADIPTEPESKISVLGNNNVNSNQGKQMSEEDYALGKLFKV